MEYPIGDGGVGGVREEGVRTVKLLEGHNEQNCSAGTKPCTRKLDWFRD